MKRIISMVLTLTMVLGLMPAAMAASPSLPETVNDLPIRPVNSALSGTITASPDEPEDGSALSETMTVVPDETGRPASSAAAGKWDQIEGGPIEAGPIGPIEKPLTNIEKQFGEGAMSLEDFLKKYPKARVYGLDRATAAVYGTAGVSSIAAANGILPEAEMASDWFQAEGEGFDITVMNTSGLGNLRVAGYTPDLENWSGPTVSTSGDWWSDLGFLPTLADATKTGTENYYPTLTTREGVTYGVSSADLDTNGDNLAIYRWGLAEYEDENEDGATITCLWVDTATSVMVLRSQRENSHDFHITLHYTPLQYHINYEIKVGDTILKIGDDASEGLVKKTWTTLDGLRPWRADLTTVEEALDAVFGASRPKATSGNNQSADFTAEIPKGNFGAVSVSYSGTDEAYNPPSTSKNAAGDSYNIVDENGSTNWPLGADVKYTINNDTNTATLNTSYSDGGPAFFSLSGEYNTGRATGDVTVQVEITRRSEGNYAPQPGVIKQGKPLGNGTIQKADDDKSNKSNLDTGYKWYEWTIEFELGGYGNAGTITSLTAINISGELVQVPGTSGTSVTTVLPTGEKVEVGFETEGDKKETVRTYTVTVTNAFRSLIIVGEGHTGNGAGDAPTLYHVTLDGNIETQLGVDLKVGDVWTRTGPGGTATVFDSSNSSKLFQYGSGENIHVTLPDGYAWANSDRNGEPTWTWAAKATREGGNDISYATLSRKNNDSYYSGALPNTNNIFNNDNSTITFVDYSNGTEHEGMPKLLPIYYNVKYRYIGNTVYLIDGDGDQPVSANPSGLPIDSTNYTNFNNSGSFNVTKQVPSLGASGGKYYEFKYWVLTDMDGNPVDENGNSVDDPSGWIKFQTNEVKQLKSLLPYTRKTENPVSEFGLVSEGENTGASIHTIHLTAVWAETKTNSYGYYLTFNSEAYPTTNETGQMTAPKTPDFYGETDISQDATNYDKDSGETHERGVYHVIPGLEVTDDGKFDVTVYQDDIISLFADDDDPSNDWLTFVGDQLFSWKGVKDDQILELWFRDTLGGLNIKVDWNGYVADSGTETIPVRLTLTLPEKDEPLTAGNETTFFDEYLTGEEYCLPVLTGGSDNMLILKKVNDNYVAELELETAKNGVTINIPRLPEGTKYKLELLNADGELVSGTDGYAVSTADAPTASSLWSKYDGIDGDWIKAKDGTVAGYTNGYGETEKGIVPYVTHNITIHIVGGFSVVLRQRSTQPDVTPTNSVSSDKISNVQNFNLLSYDATVKNLTKETQNVYVSISVASAGDRYLTLVGVGYIDGKGESHLDVDAKTNPGDRDANGQINRISGMTGEKNEIPWVYDSGNRRVVFGPIALGEGKETPRLLARTSVPPVDTHTEYTATAKVFHSDVEPGSSEPGSYVLPEPDSQLATSNEVTANVFAEWLRILAYVGTDDAADPVPAWKTGASIEFTVRIYPKTLKIEGPDGSETDRKFDKINYVLFSSSSSKGLTNSKPESASRAGSGNDDKGDWYEYKISLGHEERVVIYDVMAEDQYEVKASLTGVQGITYAAYTNNKGDPDPDGETVKVSGTIHAVTEENQGGRDTMDVAIFRFVPVHDITLTKEVVGNGPETGFNFSVELTVAQQITHKEGSEDLEGGEELTLDLNSVEINPVENSMTQDGNTWSGTVNLSEKNTYKATFINVPDGTEYSIKEVALSDDGYSLTDYVTEVEVKERVTIRGNVLSKEEEETIRQKGVDEDYKGVEGTVYRGHVDITFTNTNAKNNVKITKTVTNPIGIDWEQEFEVTVTLTLPKGYTPRDITYTGDRVDDTNVKEKAASGTISVSGATPNNDGTTTVSEIITLLPGQFITIKDLPINTEVKVEEKKNSDFDTNYRDVTDPEKVRTAADSITVEVGEREGGYAIEVINARKSDNLQIIKTFTDYIEGYDPEEFTFTVTLKDANGNAVNGSYSAGSEQPVVFKEGSTEVTIKVTYDEFEGTWSGATWIWNLPAGVTYTVTENDADNYETTYTTGNSTSPEMAEGKIGENDRVEVTNEHLTGSLTISNTISNYVEGYDSQPFTFTVTLTNGGSNSAPLTGTFGVTGKTDGETGKQFDGNGPATFSLAHGQSVTIMGLPVGATYTVDGIAPNQNYSMESQSGKEGTISNSESGDTAAFVYSHSTGDLTIKKTVTDYIDGYDPDSFTFNITLEYDGKTVSLNGVSDVEGIDYSGGEATVTVNKSSDAQMGTWTGTQTITGLPVGVKYTLEENDADNYETTYTTDNGTPTDKAEGKIGESSYVEVTNKHLTGSLTVTKTVMGKTTEGSPQFTVTLNKDINKTFGSAEFVGGVATVTATESAEQPDTGVWVGKVKIEDLPYDVTYTVDETEDNQKDGYVSVIDNSSGTISSDNKEHEVAITSYSTHTLTIEKQVFSAADSSETKGWKFEVKLTPPEGSGLTLSPKFPDETFDKKAGEDNIWTFTLKGGDIISISNLPYGTEYEVSEEKVSDYKTIISEPKGTIEGDKTVTVTNTAGVTIKKEQKKNDGSFATGEINGKYGDTITYQITLSNYGIEAATVQISDTVAKDLQGSIENLTTADETNESVTNNNGTISGTVIVPKYNVDSNAPGKVTITYTVTLPGVGTNTTYTNTATVTTSDGEKKTSNEVEATVARSYKLTYNLNGGSINGSTDAITLDDWYVSGKQVPLSPIAADPNKPTREGATFLGWTTDESASQIEYADEAPDESVITNQVTFTNDDIIVYAVWAQDVNGNGDPDYSEARYNITYKMVLNVDKTKRLTDAEAEGHLTGTEADLVLPDGTYQVTIDNEHYVFVYWSTKEVSGAVDTDPENTYDKAPNPYPINGANVTLYAVWAYDRNDNDEADYDEDQYTVTYNLNGGAYSDNDTTPPGPDTGVAGQSITLQNGDELTKAYEGSDSAGNPAIFIGWTTEVRIAKDIVNQDDTISDEDWKIIYTADKKYIYTISAEDAADETKTIIMYAVYARDANGDGKPDYEEGKARVDYYANGGTIRNGGTDPFYTCGHPHVPGQTVVELLDVEEAKRSLIFWDRHVLIGWSDQQNPAVVTSKEGESVLVKTVTIPEVDDGEEPKNAELYAVWAVDGNRNGTPDYDERYILKYDANDGSDKPGDVTDIKYGETTPLDNSLKPTHASVAGKKVIFAGWSKTPNADPLTTAPGTGYIVTSVTAPGDWDSFGGDAYTLTVYAVWAFDENNNDTPDYSETRYAVEYDIADGEGNPPVSQTGLLPGQSITLRSGGGLIKPYDAEDSNGNPAIFAGWTTEETLGGTIIPQSGGFDPAKLHTTETPYTVTADDAKGTTIITMYAVYARDANNNQIPDYREKHAHVEYYANGGTIKGEGTDPFYTCEHNHVPGQPEVSLLDLEEAKERISRTGYVLIGWSDQEEPAVVTSKEGESVLVETVTMPKVGADEDPKNAKVWAVWAIDKDSDGRADYLDGYLVSYDLKDGQPATGVDYGEKRIEEGKEITLKAAPNLSGYTFKGWKCSADNKVYQPSAKYTVRGDVTFTAQWEAVKDNGNNNSNNNNNGNNSSNSGYNNGSDDSDSTYPPSIPGASHGSVSTSPRNPRQGDTVTITPTPDAGYEVGGVTVKDSRGRALDVKDNGNGTYSFTQPGSRATINVTFVPATGAPSTAFSDVSSSDYFYEAVRWAVANGVTYGVDNTHFGPALGCTRAQFVTFLWRAAGSPRPAGAASRFGDVSRTAHAGYYDAILWAVEQGVTAGTGDGSTFSPDAVVTRAQSVTFMSRYANKAGIASKPGTASFDDVSNEGAMASYYDAISWAVANGITAGNSTTANTFGPMDDCNRGMMITFLYRLFTGNT